jgi:hypothetical protein
MIICRVCKRWKKVIEKTKIKHFIIMNEFTNISKESTTKICPLARNICIMNQEGFPNKLKQGTMFPQFTGLEILMLHNLSGFFNNLVSISKLVCASAKTLHTVSIKDVEPFAFFFMGTTFPNLGSFWLNTELKDIEFLKEFLNLLPEMFPNLYHFKFILKASFPMSVNGIDTTPNRQDYVTFIDWVRNLKFSQLPNLHISTQFEDVSYR